MFDFFKFWKNSTIDDSEEKLCGDVAYMESLDEAEFITNTKNNEEEIEFAEKEAIIEEFNEEENERRLTAKRHRDLELGKIQLDLDLQNIAHSNAIRHQEFINKNKSQPAKLTPDRLNDLRQKLLGQGSFQNLDLDNSQEMALSDNPQSKLQERLERENQRKQIFYSKDQKKDLSTLTNKESKSHDFYNSNF